MGICLQKEQTIKANLSLDDDKEKDPKSLECKNKNIILDNEEFKPINKINQIFQLENKKFESVNLISSVRSFYIIKYIFSFLDEKQRLKIIIYNKKIQKKIFKIDIDDYKIISGKFKLIKENGKGEEYKLNTNILIFEGDYIKGKKNGKGKEYYDNGKLKFEGEYLNNYPITGKGYNSNGNIIFEIKNNKGKEYYENSKLKFEGEYLNGRRWNGKGFNINGNVEYEILNGRGRVKEYDELGHLILEGEYINGKKNGKVKEYDSFGKLKFEGIYSNNYRLTGRGYNCNGIIISEIENGKIKEYYNTGKLKFEGYFLKGEKNGKGTGYYTNGNIKIEGEYLLGNINGKVKEFYEDKKLKFEGEYLNNYPITGNGYNSNGNIIYEIGNGKIKEYYNNGKLKFEGEYLNGEKTGKGKKYKYIYSCFGLRKKLIIFEGFMLDDKKWKGKESIFENDKLVKEIEYDSGKAICFKYINGVYEDVTTDPEAKYFKCYKNGKLYYEGTFYNGYKHGKGKEYSPDGKTINEVEYKNGKLFNGKEKIFDNKHKLIYEFEHNNDEFHSKGKEYKDDGKLIFEGEYLNRKRHGRGKQYDENSNLIFDGEYRNGKKQNGIEYIYYPKAKLKLEWEMINGKRKLKKKKFISKEKKLKNKLDEG